MHTPTQERCNGIARKRHAHSEQAEGRRAGFQARPERACRVCGCTQLQACPGGCSWVDIDLCSACAKADP